VVEAFLAVEAQFVAIAVQYSDRGMTEEAA